LILVLVLTHNTAQVDINRKLWAIAEEKRTKRENIMPNDFGEKDDIGSLLHYMVNNPFASDIR
jgi:hypothetical protein